MDPPDSALTRASARVPRCLGGRYNLLSLIGVGGHGEVHRARDRITDDLVAVKLVPMSGRRVGRQARREIAALRAVQLHGVVRLLDEGTDGPDAYLVMELVPGQAFPAMPLPVAWSDIAQTTGALLEILVRVHAVGVVHRDLTPGNVLVDGGRPTLLDFSVAWSAIPDDSGRAPPFGTPIYMAPEQVEGAPVSPATDLYALGSMLFEALTGRVPFNDGSAYQAMAARCLGDAPSLRTLKPDAPDAVIELVDAMLRREPARRPRDARDALDRLAGRPSQVDALAPDRDGQPWSPAELRALIAGPARIFHVPEDAAAALYARTRGERGPVRAELDAWVRRGLARRDGERVVLTRTAVDRIARPETAATSLADRSDAIAIAVAHAAAARELTPGAPDRLGHLIFALPAGGSDALVGVLEEGAAVARRSLAEGRTREGITALSDAWITARRVRERVPTAVVRGAFAAWVELALVDGTPAALDRALHEIDRAHEFARLPDLEALLRAALVVHSSPVRALEEASVIPVFHEPALERWRHGVRLQAARLGPLERERALVEELRPWAANSSDPCDRAAFVGWEAWVLYRSGRYEEAAQRHLAAAALDELPTTQLAALLSSATAHLAAWQPERALRLAASARDISAEARLPYLEARACWIERAALYRLGGATTADLDFIEAVRAVGVGDLCALASMTEAAAAWRGGDFATGRELAMDAFRQWTNAGCRWAPDLARALAIACGDAAPADEVDALVDEALGCPTPGAGLQVLGLLALAQVGVVVVASEVARLAATVPREHWSKRASVLSMDDALAQLGAGAR